MSDILAAKDISLSKKIQALGLALKQDKSTVDSSAEKEIASLIFLESSRATAYELAGIGLGEMQLLSDFADLFR